MTKANSRELALDILLEVLEKGEYSHRMLYQALGKYQYLDKSDRALISRIVHGTIESLISIDYIINQYSCTSIKKMKPLIRNLLRMSVYQIVYMDRIPDSAVCNEAVKLAVKRRFQGLKGFVNGVLRTVAREKQEIQWPDQATAYSMPEWIIDLWKKHYPDHVIEKMLKSFLEPSRITVRCNSNKVTRERIIESLASQGVMVEISSLCPSVLLLGGIDYLEGLEAFTNGWIQVQDLSSALVGCLAAPQKGDYIIDVCSAPGGKALHLADLLAGTGHVEARDLTEYKVQMVEENCRRAGFTNLSVQIQDALSLREDSIAKADLVLADLPCSGLGIIGKKPDIKYQVNPDQLNQLAALQRSILTVVQQYVKPGGRLIYSTCTINRVENEDNASWFAGQFPFEPVTIEGKLGPEMNELSMKRGYLQLLPGMYPCDGFFISVFERKELCKV